MALASAVFLAFSIVCVKIVSLHWGVIRLTTLRLVVSGMLVVIVAVVAGKTTLIFEVPKSVLGILLGAGVIVMVGHVLLVKAIELEDVSRVSPATTGLYILVSVVMSALFDDKSVSWQIMLGGLMVILGVFSLSISQHQDGSRLNYAASKASFVALGLATSVGVAWAIGVILMNEVVKHIEPIPATAIRVPFMALVLMGIAGLKGDVWRCDVSWRDLATVFLSGIFLGVSTLTFVAALKWSSPSVVVILNSTTPFFVATIAFTWLREKVNPQVVLGTLACFVGVCLTLF